MRRGAVIYKYLLLLSLALVVSCSLASAEPTRHRIGVLIPLTGNYANYGSIVRKEIEKFQIPEIEWVFEDEACEYPAQTISAFKKISTIDNISYLIGPCCGSPQKAIAPLLRDKKQLVLLPNAASESVFPISGRKMYSVQYSLEADGAFRQA